MIKVLFLIHDLGPGGAEKVLVNLVNHMDRTKFDITVMALFGGGVHEKSLRADIHLINVFPKMIPGNSKLLKLGTSTQLHRLFIRDKYDIEISYLEGPTARIISGCPDKNVKLVSWIHSKQSPIEALASSFRSVKEAKASYDMFNYTVCVSEDIKKDFCETLDFAGECNVLYNTIESEKITALAKNEVPIINQSTFNMIAVGTLKEVKGFDRLLDVAKRLHEETYEFHLYILGEGPLRGEMEQYIQKNQLNNIVSLLGFHENPYQYVEKCDLFVCSSYSEGFSTAVTEALIVGTAVCTTEVSGMKELLGENNEYGVIVPNDTDGLYQGIKAFLDCPEMVEDYIVKAKERGRHFHTDQTIKKVEEMLESLI